MISFTIGTAAQGPNFYGRETEIDQALSQRWSWICAQRRIGKSSLLLKLQSLAKESGDLPLFYDLSKLREGDSSEELFAKFFRAHQRKVFKDLGINKKDFKGMRPEEAFEELVNRLSETEKDVIFLWDEAERLIDIQEKDPGFLDSFAASLRTNERFRLVIAGTQSLANLFPDEDQVSSFISTFRWISLAGLDPDASERLLKCENTGGWESPLPDSIVAKAIEWCGGHTLILQEVGDRLAREVDGDGASVTEEHLDLVRKQIYGNTHLQRIFVNDQSRLTEFQQLVLRAICETAEDFAIEDLAESIGKMRHKVEQAASFLANFGYLKWEDRIVLQYRFYPGFLSMDSEPTVTDEGKAAKLKPTLFVSYSHEDVDEYKNLIKFLSPLIRASATVCFWSDEKIKPGDTWDEEINIALEEAHIGLLLITQNFLNSEFITNTEVPKLIKKAKEGRLRLLCLYMRPSTVEGVEFPLDGDQVYLTTYQGLNSPDDPIQVTKNPEQALADVCAEIAKQLKDFKGK